MGGRTDFKRVTVFLLFLLFFVPILFFDRVSIIWAYKNIRVVEKSLKVNSSIYEVELPDVYLAELVFFKKADTKKKKCLELLVKNHSVSAATFDENGKKILIENVNDISQFLKDNLVLIKACDTLDVVTKNSFRGAGVASVKYDQNGIVTEVGESRTLHVH